VWKIEGLEREEDGRAVVDHARSGGRGHVLCVVLGRGADRAAVERWLRVGSTVQGFAGFAIGRTIWFDPLKAWTGGDLPRDEAAGRVADAYRRMVDVYRGA
jgi:myo-inositol catabolism protein IolC